MQKSNEMTILNLETSTNICSVALSNDGLCVFSRVNTEGMNHATMLSPFIAEALKQAEHLQLKINAIAVSGGPGSYTGLRIGVSTAKGLAYGFGVPLIALSTLRVITQMAINKIVNPAKNSLFCAMIDARRMEVYAAFYDLEGKLVRAISADIIDEQSYTEILDNHEVYFFGNGASKCSSTITHDNAHFIDEIIPVAENMIHLAETALTTDDTVDIAYYEPFYLKEFHTTTPKSNL